MGRERFDKMGIKLPKEIENLLDKIWQKCGSPPRTRNR